MTKPSFPASALAAAAGSCANTIHRRAAAEHWQKRPQGVRIFYVPPPSLASKIKPAAPYDPAQLDRELLRAAAVCGFRRILASHPHWGTAACYQQCVREFKPLFRFSERALRMWVVAAAQHGLRGLVEQRKGRCGRKARTRPMHAYRITRAREIARHLQSGLTLGRVAKVMQLGEQTVSRDLKLLKSLGYTLTFSAATRRWTVTPPKERNP